MALAGAATQGYSVVVAAVSLAALLVSTATIFTLTRSRWSPDESRTWFLVGIAFCEVNAVLLAILATYTLTTGHEASVLMLLGAFGVLFAVVGGYRQTRTELLCGCDLEDC